MKSNHVFFMFSLSLSLAIVGCASVPKDAPIELKQAQAELDRADDLDSDVSFPKTVATAEENLDESIVSFKKFKDNNSMESMSKAVAQANNSYKLALGANELTSNIKVWDKNIYALEGNYSISQLITNIKDLQAQTAQAVNEKLMAEQEKNSLKQLMAAQQLKTPLAKMSDFKIQTPIAYFGTNQSDVSDADQLAIAELAKAIKAEPALMVSVAGYADGRGAYEDNEKLSSLRAQNVAEILEDEGIDSSRIQVLQLGEKYSYETENPALLQLDRKVVVTIGIK